MTVDRGAASGVVLADGRSIEARVVLGACDPYRLMSLVPDGGLPAALTDRMNAVKRPGTTLKVNLALTDLPRFACLPDDSTSPFGSTIHLLPGSAAWPASARPTLRWRHCGRCGRTCRPGGCRPSRPSSGMCTPRSTRRSGTTPATTRPRCSCSPCPTSSAASTWEAELPGYVERLLDICDRYAPGMSGLVADMMPLTPPGIEEHFGMTGGHIHHVDNTVAFDERMPYFTGLDGLYAGSRRRHPAGSVIGAAGHNAARRILADLGLR